MTKDREIDIEAIRIPKDSGLLPCLYVPIAARDEQVIEKYVGRIVNVLIPGIPNKALLIESDLPLEPDLRLPIWALKESSILHSHLQVWVDLNYTKYRLAYRQAFPSENLDEFVLDHILNRKVARLKGYRYLRIVPISRSANSSSGCLAEQWSVEYHSSQYVKELNRKNRSSVQYADLADLVKMLNINVGGGVMDVVNEAQKLVDLP